MLFRSHWPEEDASLLAIIPAVFVLSWVAVVALKSRETVK